MKREWRCLPLFFSLKQVNIRGSLWYKYFVKYNLYFELISHRGMRMLTIVIRDLHGNVEVEKKIAIGQVVPVNPIPDRGEVFLSAGREVAEKIATAILGNVPYSREGATAWNGELAGFVYTNLRGKKL